MPDSFNVDLLSPAAVTEKAESIGVAKANNTLRATVMLGILAGAFIAFAGEFYTLAVFDARMGPSITRLVGGLVFSLGLILVVIAGAELFTGNTLLVIAWMTRKISFRKLMRNWVLVYLGNLIGALGLVVLVFLSEQWQLGNYAFGTLTVKIALDKVSNDPFTNMIRGILGNGLVVLALWLSFAGRTVTDKILAIIFPITAFVSSGFEHSIANMYFVPFGLVLKNQPAVQTAFAATYPQADLANLTTASFLINNLIPVTIGNIIGGAVLVGLVYWFVYLHKNPVARGEKGK